MALLAQVPRVWRCVLTGGPHAGKTNAIAGLAPWMRDHGWGVIVLPELATDLFSHGVMPRLWPTGEENGRLRRIVLSLQLARENAAMQLAAGQAAIQESQVRGYIVLQDRGLWDEIPCCNSPDDFRLWCDEYLGKSAQAITRDAVVCHLDSTATRADLHYGSDSDPARQEQLASDACARDEATWTAWGEHRSRIRVAAQETFAHRLVLLKEALLPLLKRRPF